MNKKWTLREKISDDLEKQLLFYRGIKTEEEIEKFFNPDYGRDLRDAFDFIEMKKITDRIVKAVKSHEKIVIFGDYDADGIGACAIFHDFFQKIGFENFDVYIPDRMDGYGLNLKIIDEFVRQKVGLVITVDCGITDNEEIKKANKGKIDVIVTDHHLPPDELPPAFAMLDPLMERENYPFKKFTGAGLAFKVVSALCLREEFKIIPGWEKWLLDVAAISTIADMFPLIDENRVLVFYGLEVLKKTRREGLIYLLEKLQIDKANVNEDDISFSVAPCINVASRMEHAAISYALLTTESKEEADALSQKLIEKNEERKKLTDEIFKQISLDIDGVKLPDVFVFGDSKWPVGILAPLANKLLEKYSRPVFLWAGDDADGVKGSCRSDGSINLVDFMAEIGNKIFIESGGHVLAAGFTVKNGQLKNLKKEIEEAYRKMPHDKIEPPAIWLDAELNLDNIDWNFISFLNKFRPFGMGNPKPVFLFSNLEVFGTRTFGNGGIHLQLNFKKSNGEIISAIGFFMQQHLDFLIEKGTKIDLAASVEENRFNGRHEIRLRIVDMRKAE